MDARWTRYAQLYILTLVALVAAADLGHLPAAVLLHRVPGGDKLGHFLLMGLLSLVVHLAWDRRRPEATGRWRISLGLLLLVVLEEVSQLWLGNRHFEWMDLFADAAGILFFAVASKAPYFQAGTRVAGSTGSPSRQASKCR